MSWCYQIWTAKCLYSQSDNWPEILGKTTAQECKKSTSGCARKTSMLKFVLVSSNLTLSKKLRVWSYLNESVQKWTVDMLCVYRGLFSKYLGWNKPCSRFVKALVSRIRYKKNNPLACTQGIIHMKIVLDSCGKWSVSGKGIWSAYRKKVVQGHLVYFIYGTLDGQQMSNLI